MAYKTEELFETAKKVIKKHNLFFIEDVVTNIFIVAGVLRHWHKNQILIEIPAQSSFSPQYVILCER